jgi:hypothetical protein
MQEHVSINQDSFSNESLFKQIENIASGILPNPKALQIVNEHLADTKNPKRIVVLGDELSLFPKPSFKAKSLFLLDSVQFNTFKDKFTLASKINKNLDYEGKNTVYAFRENNYKILAENQVIKPIS